MPPSEEADAALLRHALDGSAPGVALLDRSGVVLLVNDAWTRLDALDGLLAGARAGTDLPGILRAAPPDAADARQVLRGIEDVAEGRTDRFRHLYRGRGPGRCWVRVTGAAVDDRVVLTREDATAYHGVLEELARRLGRRRPMEREDALRLLAGLSSGRRRLELEPCDLAPHLDAVHEAFRARLGDDDRHLTKRVLGPLPALVDTPAFDQALLELLLNAQAATRPDGSIHMEAQVEGDEVRVCVIDDGRGFDAGELAARMEALDAEEQQEGVGLALAKMVMAHHEGHLRLSSDAQGAVAVLALPVRR